MFGDKSAVCLEIQNNINEVSLQHYRLPGSGVNQNGPTSPKLLLYVHIAARHNAHCCHRAGELNYH
jgi:hypothetical protein